MYIKTTKFHRIYSLAPTEQKNMSSIYHIAYIKQIIINTSNDMVMFGGETHEIVKESLTHTYKSSKYQCEWWIKKCSNV